MNLKPAKVFFELEKNVLFALLFGSHVKGVANPASDIDIAVYLSPNISPSRFLDIRLKFMAECPVKGTKDVVILNESPPLLAYEAVSYGKPIMIRDKRSYIGFKADSYCRYFDTQKLRDIQYRAMVERIKGGRIGHFEGDNSIKAEKIREFSRKIARARKAH